MQDGSFQNASGGVYLSTDAYTILEVKLLATSLSEKFNHFYPYFSWEGADLYMKNFNGTSKKNSSTSFS